MVEFLRAYRRWLSRRLALLGACFAVALVVSLWVALGAGTPIGLRITGTFVGALIWVLLGCFIAQTLQCGRLQAGRGRRAARILRGQLAGYRVVALTATLILGALVAGIELFPDPAPPSTAAARFHRLALRRAEVEGPTRFEQVAQDEAAPALASAEVAGRPQAKPIMADLPLELRLMEHDFEPPPVQDFPKITVGDSARVDSQEEGIPEFRPEAPTVRRPDPEPPVLPEIERLGLWDESDRTEWIPPEARLDALLVNAGGHSRGVAGTLMLDLPINRDESLRTAVLAALLTSDEELGGGPEESWQRLTFEFVRRLAGYTRHAVFDFSLGAGFSVDGFSSPEGESRLDSSARLSPYVAVDLALWQKGTFGFLLHAGQSFPINLAGASSSVLDLSATVRVDLSERVSLHAGYRWLLIRLREYEDAFAASGSRLERADVVSGPLIGIDMRF